MPSGPKKRLAARRRSIGARTSLDKESVSGSHASDEGTSPKTFDDVNSGLSLATGSNERPTDQTFQTEEWVRVSDFDVGTPTSTTAKGGFHATAEDSYGDSRGHDKIVDWETISGENADNFSSPEDVGEARDVAASDYGQERGQQMPHVDELLSDSSVSDKEDDAKSVKSRENSHSSSSSSSSSSGSSRSSYSPEAYLKKSDDEERLGSIVVIPSHGEDSQESSFAEVASVETRDDDYHELIANIGSLEVKGSEDQATSAIEPASSDDQEEDKYDLFSGVEDQAVESAPSKDQEKDKNGGSNTKDLEQEQSKDEEADTKVRKLEHQTPGQSENEYHQVAKPKELESEVPTVKEQVSEPHAPDQNLEEDEQGIEPTTPDKASEKSYSENPYSFGHSISDEEVFEDGNVSNLKEIEDPSASLSAHEQTDHAESSSEVHENISKEGQDSPVSTGVPEPEQHELNQLLEIAQSKEIAKLGKVEQKILAQEHDASNGIAVLQPLVEVLTADKNSKRLERDEVKDHQADEAPLPRDTPCSVDSGLPIEAGLKDVTLEMYTKEVEAELRGDRFGDKNQSGEVPLTGDSSSADSSLQAQEQLTSRDAEKHQRLLDGQSEVDSPFSVDNTEPRTAVEGDTLVSPINAAESELPRSSGVLIKDVEDSCLVGKVDGTTDAAKCSESSERVELTPYHKREVQGRPIEASSGSLGCCEPVQWLLANLTRWVNPPAIRN
ncbi:uncharacterized protein [Physcomitrium patens]|uniref:uncharacterized protein isoform X2 n=1 Tax=Physcomitrium patens TaxID=3218 RepID=UPI000D161FEE|nr:midasin-like isoform X2 [Physcomitrium patens]|eukprot:XP_024402554.1 midasin-like isoform X2 [Physcomitrella patens]